MSRPEVSTTLWPCFILIPARSALEYMIGSNDADLAYRRTCLFRLQRMRKRMLCIVISLLRDA